MVRPHCLPTLTSIVNRFGQDAADEGIRFEILFNPGLVQIEANLLGQAVKVSSDIVFDTASAGLELRPLAADEQAYPAVPSDNARTVLAAGVVPSE